MTNEKPMEMRYMEAVEDSDSFKCACGKTATYFVIGQKSVLNAGKCFIHHMLLICVTSVTLRSFLRQMSKSFMKGFLNDYRLVPWCGFNTYFD